MDRLLTMCFRKIKKSFKRYLSLIVLSLLGVSFFVGMKISEPNLMESLDKYYKDKNVFDIEIISSNGLTDGDIEALKKDNIKVYGTHSVDALTNGENNYVLRIKEINNSVNRFDLIDGRMPQNFDEIVIDEKYLLDKKAKIGDTISVKSDLIKVDNLKVVGVVNSPLYLATSGGSLNRGSTVIGNGEVKLYAYGLSDLFDMDYYTEVYIDNLETKYMKTGSDIYNKKTDELIDSIDGIKGERIKIRYQELRDIAIGKIKKEEEEVNREIEASYNSLSEFKNNLDESKRSLDEKKSELDRAYAGLNSVKNNLDSSENNLGSGYRELESKKTSLDNLKGSINYEALLNGAKKNQSNTLTKDDIILLAPEDDKEQFIDNIETASAFGFQFYNTTVIKQQLTQYGVSDYIAKIEEIEKGFAVALEIENGYNTYYQKLDELNRFKLEIERGRSVYNSSLNDYNDGYNLYNKLSKEYENGIEKYNEAKIELDGKKEAARVSFEKAYKKVDENITEGTWHINSRLDNTDYLGFINSISSLKKLSMVFPIIFFVVAVFISLLSMARMGVEDRSEIGTLKAFGFSKLEILKQYIIYSLSASVIGAIFGSVIGLVTFPRIIFDVYTKLYALPEMIYGNFYGTLFTGTLISILCITLSSVFTIMMILKRDAITLLRPISPVVGKKIFLERFPLLWDKITFEHKITLRNIFRYKRRVLMTLAGIVSCAMLLVSAFLIKDSIKDVLDKQFKDIFKYDSIIYLDGKKISYELDSIFSSSHIDKLLHADLERYKLNDTPVNAIVSSNEELKGIIELDTKLDDGGVIITSKLAKMYGIKENDIIKINTADNKSYDLRVSSITNNYIGHYIYMSKDYYEKNIGMYKINVSYIKFDDSKFEEMEIKKLLKNENVLGYLSINSSVAMVQNMFISLDKMVLIVVIFSLALSVVILYSLAYIIISERQREIATLKVLGFDDEEVDMYLLKEQVIILSIGILLGLIVGIIYSLFLVDTLEIDIVQLSKNLTFESYMICIILLVGFSVIVGQMIHFRLKKISMTESLKSVE